MKNLKNLTKRGFALFLALVLCLGLLNLTALAAESEDDPQDNTTVEVVEGVVEGTPEPDDADPEPEASAPLTEEGEDISGGDAEGDADPADPDAEDDADADADVDPDNDADANPDESAGDNGDGEDDANADPDAEVEDEDKDDVEVEDDAEVEDEDDTKVEDDTEPKDDAESEGNPEDNPEDNPDDGIMTADLDEDEEDQPQDGAIVVTTANELKDAISNAEDGAVIDVQADIGNYTITMNSEKSITIMSSNGSIIEDDYRVGFSVSKGSLTFENITINCTSGTLTPGISGGTLTVGTGASITNIGLAVKGGTLVLDGGSISGKAVTVTSGTFEVNSGSVGSTTVSGGTFNLNGGQSGIVTVSGGTFNMNGGAISGNNYTLSINGGGGVFVKSGTFNMFGGEISNNTAKPTYTTANGNGGGVYVSGGTFNMSGGTISNNQALAGGSTKTFGYGGGVYVASGAVFNMSGGTITGNKATSLGGGVYSIGTFNMTGGEISGNNASSGGGVYVSGTFTMSSGDITGNNANTSGGGVYVSATFNYGGGVISGNTAKGTVGSDVYLSTGKFITVTGELAEDAEIMVELVTTGQSAPAKTAGTVIATGTVTEDDAAKFKTNSTSHDVGLSEDGNSIVLVAPPAPAVYTSADGSTTQDGEFTAMLTLANTSGGTVTLRRDVLLTAGVDITGSNVTLDLNGHVLSRGASAISATGYVIKVDKGGNLLLKDSSGDNSGTITGGYYWYGGGVCVWKGTFTMESGTISGNKAPYQTYGGGGVFVSSGCTFTMKGGAISGNSTVYGVGASGGGVLVWGTFTMDGGTISNNYASNGGGVCINGGTFNLNGGTLVGNQGGTYGGTVYVKYRNADYQGTFTMKGGTIDGVSTVSTHSIYGGGVCIGRKAVFTMYNGTISNFRSSASGGGLHVMGTFTMYGGTITGNYSGVDGGGIMIQNGAVGSIYGGYITNNTADCRVKTASTSTDDTIYPYGGGGIYVNGGHAYELDENGNEVLDDLGNKIASANNGELYLYNVVITDNHTNVGNAKGYEYGGGIANCPTSYTEVYLANGGAIYGNDASQVFVSSSSGVSHSVFLSGYMLGGAPYNWTDENGEQLANVGILQTLAGSDKVNAYNSLTSKDDSVSVANGLAKVFITGNSSTCYGGGIGSNGNVYIGSDLGVLQLTKTVVGDTNETEFTFTVTLTVNGEPYTGTVVVNGTEQKLTDGKLTITLENGETALVTGIPENASYEITENESNADQVGITVDGVKSDEAKGTIAVESAGGTSVVFTNTYGSNEPDPEPETTSLTVNKVWAGTGAHPGSVTVRLYNSSGAYGDIVTLSDENNWSYTWTGLDASDEWTVREVSVPNGYTPSYTTNADGSVTITNTPTPVTPPPTPTPDPDPEPEPEPEEPQQPDQPEEEEDLDEPDVPLANLPEDPELPEEEIPDEGVPLANAPETGDNMGLWMAAAAMSAMGLMALLGKHKEDEEA